MRKDVLQWLIPVVLAVAVVIALWFYWWQSERPPEEIQPELEMTEPEPAAEEPPPGPEHPLEDTGEAAAREPETRPPPTLEESDEVLKLELSGLFGETLEEQLARQDLVERIVATIDNLPRERIADRIRPMSGVSGQLAVEPGDSEEQYVLSPENFERYDALVGMVANADTADMEQLYRRFYPLFQRAYAGLGYPDGYFNDRVIEVIDHLLATPEPEGPVKLTRPHVLYEYADPELEQLSPGQKLLLRMGNEHANTIKAKLRDFRARIVSG